MENQSSNPGEWLWRRKLSEAGRKDLQAQPELELDARLAAALAEISDAPVPSNFTARVLAAVELEEAATARPRGWAFQWQRLWPRVAVATAILIFAGVSFQRYENHSRQAAMATTIAMVVSTPTVPNVDALENLDAIQRMSQSGHADGELLAALQ